MKKGKLQHKPFPGFVPPEEFDENGSGDPDYGGFLRYPMVLQQFWYQLSGSEQKVMDFIIRQTYGWNKTEDAIAWSLFEKGIGQGQGTGLSRTQIRKAVSTLEKKGFITVTRYKHRPCTFHLVLRKEQEEIDILEAERKVARLMNERFEKCGINIRMCADDEDFEITDDGGWVLIKRPGV